MSVRSKLLGVVALAAIAAVTPACEEFDTTRQTAERGTVGEEMYGVLCDRVAAQAIREDLTGASFRGVCHKVGSGKTGKYEDKVDESLLPAIDPEAVDEKDRPVSVDKQKKDRAAAVGRVHALVRRRTDLIRALDATFPKVKIGIKDLANEDPTKTCQAPKSSGEGFLTDQIADMLGKFGDLYNDGTLPQSTQSLARVMEAFKKDEEAQAAWARISARNGYRPIDTALGATRPLVAYPQLRDLANASLRLLSADSQPYQLDPKFGPDGLRIPVPGPGNASLVKMMEAAHEELLDTKVDPRPSLLRVTADAGLGRSVVSRPRDNLEIMQEILFSTDSSFGGGNPTYIVRRDARGYAAIAGGAVPSPFIDGDKDGLPDVDALGRFKTTDGSLAPSPFQYPGGQEAQRDPAGRVIAGKGFLYEYMDTSHTFAAQMLADLKPLANPDPEQKHETLMDMLGGFSVAVGARQELSKSFSNGQSVKYQGIPKDSPILDLVYALGTILGDRTSDQTLALAHDLFATKPQQMARITGAMSGAFDIAQKHPEAKIPANAIFWDEQLDAIAKIAKEPGLLEDVLKALAAPETAQLGTIFSRYANFKDEITYDKNDINGLAFNLTTNTKSEMRTPVDRGQPQTGKNRSAMYRFLGLISDTTGVTACNKPNAKVHAKAFGLSVDMPIGSGTYQECEVFKLENLAAFYLDSIANAAQYEPDSKPNKKGTFYLRDNLLRTGIVGIGAATVDLMQDSSGLTGFWTEGGSRVLAAKPNWLNRLVFFDLKGDTVNSKTNTFIKDLQGEFIGTSVCPERVITDPVPDAPDASSDGKVRGLRNCPPGQWLQERGKHTLFTWENFGFYDAMRPLLGAFVKHNREDLFLELSNAAYKYWPNGDASPDECRLPGGKQCPKAGMNSYEPLIVEAFATDVMPALQVLAKELENLPIKRCDEMGANGVCSKVTTISGIDVAAAATRAMVDPEYSKNTLKLTDRRGAANALRNDGNKNPQTTPAYLLTGALSGIDKAFDAFEQQHPDDKGERRANWRRARSQLVDQFMGTTGAKATAQFANPTMSKMTPVIIDIVRAQLNARCPKSFTPPYEKCTWARDDLAKHAEETMTGPLMSSGLDMMDAIRSDPEGRRQMGVLLQYLLDAASKNEALPSMLASMNDMMQLLRDEENLVPLYHVLAAAAEATSKDEKGNTKKSLVDAQMALLAKVSGKYFDKDGKEICSREIDPNQVLAVALGNLVTPINDGDFKGQAPLEVIIDIIADVNRIDPTQPYEGTLEKKDYGSVSQNVVEFLTDKERGLEQFYEVIRQGTKTQ